LEVIEVVLGLVEIADSADTHPQRYQHFGDVVGIFGARCPV
jgi:hypothetical protein